MREEAEPFLDIRTIIIYSAATAVAITDDGTERAATAAIIHARIDHAETGDALYTASSSRPPAVSAVAADATKIAAAGPDRSRAESDVDV